MRRTARLFALAEHLRGRRAGVTAESLAERFHVSVRTIYRDLDTLRDASLPLRAERGPGGGFALDRTYTMPPVGFTVREALLLVTAGRLLDEQRLMPFTDTLASALDKVRAALPAGSQRELEHLARSLTFVGVPAFAASAPVRSAIETAWFEGRALRVHYQGAKGTTVRRVRIVSIVMDRAETLLNCQDLEIDEARQLKLHRVARAEVLETRVAS